MRLKIPSLRGIEAFLAAADMGSMRAAANAMNLTVSAVSHRIQVLEGELGVLLFERHGQTLRLTAAGTLYRKELLPGLDTLERATARLRQTSSENKVRVATIPLFYSNWVTPRLSGFLRQFPKVQIELMSIDTPAAEDADLIIRPIYNEHGRAGEQKLVGWQGTPICHPALVERYNLREPRDLINVTLIDLETPLDLWSSWFAMVGLSYSMCHDRLVVDSQALMYDAALAQLGVAMATTFFGHPYLKRGLVWPFDVVCELRGGMFINTEKPDESDAVRGFRDWLIEQVEQTTLERQVPPSAHGEHIARAKR